MHRVPRLVLSVMAVAVLHACASSGRARREGTVDSGSTDARPAAVAGTPDAPVDPDPVIRSVTAWNDGGGPGERVRTEHYNLHLALKDPVFQSWMPRYMEACFTAYATQLGPLPRPDEPLDLFIFATRNAWEAWTRRTLGREADLYLGLGRGGFTTDGTSILFDIGRVDTLTIAAHEGWHQFSQRSLRQPLPTWMEEGLACWMEGTRLTRTGVPTAFRPWRNFERWNELRNASRAGRLMPLSELLETSPQICLERSKDDLLTYYAQCWALIHFLNEGEGGRHAAALRQVLADAAAGSLATRLSASQRIQDPALRRRALQNRLGSAILLEYFTADLPGLQQAYEAFVEQVCRRGAGDRIYRGESPLSDAAKASDPPKP
ncbi:MAG: hypothetical protein RLZZ558_1831 [Planctomycetota bacterium]|jgi:hypothetical protein